MNSKILSIFSVGILMLALMIGFASAGTFSLSPTTLTFSKGDSSENFTIKNDHPTDTLSLSLSSTTINSGSNSVSVSFNPSSISNLAAGATSSAITATTSVPSNFPVGEFTKLYTISETGNSSNSEDLNLVFINSFCSAGSVDDSGLVLKVDITNAGEGDDDTWLALDRIEVEVELENDKGIDLDNVIFELGLFKKDSTSNIIDEMNWISKDNEEVEVGDIDDGKDELYLFEFIVNPSEITDDDYILVVKAYPDGDESDLCIDHSSDLGGFGDSEYFADIKVDKESDRDKMVVIDENSYPNPITAFCGATASFSADIYNIGDRDFEDQIKVVLLNNELGINIEEIINGDLDEGEKARADFSFPVPDSATEKTYTLQMAVYYDYDKDDDSYDRVSEESFEAFLKVEGNCAAAVSEEDVLVSAALESGGNAGEILVVKVTVTNLGSASSNYVLNPSAYTPWANSASVVPQTVTVAAGSSQDVRINFDVKADASGEQNFNIEVLSNGDFVLTQPVSVTISPKSVGFPFTGFSINSGNAYLWGLGFLNIILVIAIIVVVVRVLRK